MEAMRPNSIFCQTGRISTQQTNTTSVASEYCAKLNEWVERASVEEYALRSEVRNIAATAHQNYLNGEHLGKGQLEGWNRPVNLELNNSGLTECPPLFEGLEGLDIKFTAITALPQNLPSTLSQLIACYSKLEKLPQDIAITCPRLMEFQLANTPMTELPTLPFVKTLTIKGTNITQLPESIIEQFPAIRHQFPYGYMTSIYDHGTWLSTPLPLAQMLPKK